MALNNLAVAAGRQRRIDEAMGGFERASRADPAYSLPRANILRIGRRVAWLRRLAAAFAVGAVAVALAIDGSKRWSLAIIMVILAAALELARYRFMRRLPTGARTLVADDARARRFRVTQWDWTWPVRLRPWRWLLLKRAPPGVALALHAAALALLLASGNPFWVLFAVALPASLFRARRSWRRAHPGAGSWRPPGSSRR